MLFRTFVMLISLLIPAGFISAAAQAQEPTPQLEPFTATYAAKYSGFGVTATRELSGRSDNWRLDFNAHSMFADILEYSRFSDQAGLLTPQHYEYHKTGLGKDRHTVLNFEPDRRRVVNVSDAKRTIDNSPANIQDKISYQLQLALDIAAGKENLKYQVVDGKRIREYEFTLAGSEQLQTPLGLVDTIKVQRVREDSDRATTIWFAPKWNYALVKLMQREEDGKDYQISLTKLSLDGKNVTANK